MPEMTYLQAISDGLREEMRHDETVFCLGEDIGAFGGAFKVTDGFIEEFGADRVWDTPLAESAIVGTAVGAAIEGMRPVCEMQFADFIACGFDQLVNVAAKMHYRQGIAVPMVVRLPSGGGFSGGPFHSQNPEAWFLQSPGLKVVAPSTPEDAKGLLAAAIRDPNPVLFMEHKNLYRRAKGEVAEGRYETPIGEARLAREGTDLSVIAYGQMVPLALEATEDLDGASVGGARPAHAVPARRGGDPRVGAQDEQGRGAARGHAVVRCGRRGGRPDRRALRSRTSTARSSGSPRPTRRSRSARRSSARSCPSPATSRRRAVSSSPTETTLVEVTMPQMGVSVAEGTVVEWKKRVGDWVESDEPIVEISTDKVETEVPVAGVRACGGARCRSRRHGRCGDRARSYRHGCEAG